MLAESCRALVSLFYPSLCEGCGMSVPAGQYLCEPCLRRAPRISPPFCRKCSEPFPGDITSPFDCANCGHRTVHFEAAVSAYRSRGLVRQLLHEFKYRKALYLRYPLGQWLVEAMEDERLRGQTFDLLVPVPLHPARQRSRGFNQAQLLAEVLSGHTDLPLRPLLQRVRFTTTQTAFDRAERMENLRNAFRLRKNADVRGLRVLLIDDVLTTGSTLSECARVLRAGGAASVHAVTAARA